jgi:predicted PolB exonuclease-like 3'-5' exonuclease
MHYLVMDIETIPNPEVEWKPPEDKPNAFPPINKHRIACIAGMRVDTQGPEGSCYNLACFGSTDDEYNVLLDFVSQMSRTGGAPTLVTFNGRGFDMPVILARCMRYGVQARWAYGKDFRYRYSPAGHLDIADQMSDYGASHRPSLLQCSQAIGMPGKVGIDGSQVAQYYADGKLDVIKEYGCLDVLQTGFILLRWLHMKGEISEDIYNTAVKRGLRLAEGRPLLEKAVAEMDEEILLLPATKSIIELPF